MRRRYKNKYLHIILIFLLLILSIGVGYSYLTTSLNITGNVKGTNQTGDIVIETGSNPNLKITTPTTNNNWQEGSLYKFQYSFRLSNIGSVNYDNYKITLKFNNNIVSADVWNNDYQINNNILTIIRPNYNLAAGGYVDIGFIIASNSPNLKITSVKLEVVTDIEEIDPNLFEIVFNKANEWGSYVYQYNVVLRNKTGRVINSWQFEINFPENTSFQSGWSAIFENNDKLTVKNTTYNGRIENNASITIGLQVSTNIVNFIPTVSKVLVR